MLESAIVAALLSFGGGWYVGESRCEAKHEAIQASIEATRKASQEAAAEEIAKIKIEHQTVQNTVEREVRVVKDYSVCKHSEAAWTAIQKEFK